MHPEELCRKVVEHQAHLGIAHDGDADRVLLCDETGTMIDGDDIMAIAALDLIKEPGHHENMFRHPHATGGLSKKTLVTTDPVRRRKSGSHQRR